MTSRPTVQVFEDADGWDAYINGEISVASACSSVAEALTTAQRYLSGPAGPDAPG